jgi:rRNA maturation endonuclease Nob1
MSVRTFTCQACDRLYKIYPGLNEDTVCTYCGHDDMMNNPAMRDFETGARDISIRWCVPKEEEATK